MAWCLMRTQVVLSLAFILFAVTVVLPQAAISAPAQQAYLYEAGLENAVATRDEASVVWSAERLPPGKGLQADAVIRGKVLVANRAVKADLLFRRNGDPSLSASHIIEIRFEIPAGFSGESIDSVSSFAMKSSEDARSEPLTLVPAKFGTNHFVYALNDLELARKANEKLLLQSDSIELPITYATGQRALLTLHWGEQGRSLFRQAMKEWAATGIAAIETPPPQVANTNPVKTPEPVPSIDAGDSRRVALVIGNNAYREIPQLDNPANDARDTAEALRNSGFEVTLALDATRADLENRMAEFARSARDADAALIYYAGHGIQHNGVNYLIPVDGELADETDLRRFIKVRDVIADLQGSSGVKILILDACRDNEAVKQLAANLPKTRSAAFRKGLADEKATGVLIAFAAQPGSVAIDGLGGRNSPFTSALLNHINTPDLELRTLFTRVRAQVYEATKGSQLPETSDSMIGEFRFQSDQRG